MHFSDGWHMGAMWVWLLFVVVVLLLGWAAFATRARSQTAPKSPEQIVKQRFARGEIDRETYERMLEDLRK